jgi:hypothetical protein
MIIKKQIMKKKLLLLVMLGIFSVGMLQAQLRKIPSEVTDALETKYPDASNVEWKDNLTNFEAIFNMDDADWSAQFSSKGDWKETTKKMDFDALPAAVKDGFSKSKYNDWTTGSVRMIQQDDKNTVYKIYAEKNSLVQKVFLYFNENGQLQKEAPGI